MTESNANPNHSARVKKTVPPFDVEKDIRRVVMDTLAQIGISRDYFETYPQSNCFFYSSALPEENQKTKATKAFFKTTEIIERTLHLPKNVIAEAVGHVGIDGRSLTLDQLVATVSNEFTRAHQIHPRRARSNEATSGTQAR